jgi:hypothetical protein
MTTQTETIRWDDSSDSQNPGWVVLTETAGWQPVPGDREDDVSEDAAAVVQYHDCGGPVPY